MMLLPTVHPEIPRIGYEWTPEERKLKKQYELAVVKGSTCADHAKDEPKGYLQWHGWAERKAKTHRQMVCAQCGLWAIWKPKARTTNADNGKDGE
jgi:hypothetical protein